ncbi:hypothetical protein [Kluyvera sp. CHPC 1.251]|uniref:hypothetical protein n=1 Tax=Kluyvera sp. CHPC 1.251 TaxID=2995175 RepID=UPI002FD7C70B
MSVWISGTTPGSRKTAERAIAISAAVAGAGLLAKLSIAVSVTQSLVQLFALGLSFAVGMMLASTGSVVRHGFPLSAVGWLLVLLSLLGGQTGLLLLPGIVTGGLGLGLAHGRLMADNRIVNALSSVAALVAVLLIQANSAPGINGYGFAFAVVIDLTLLGVVLVRIAETERK